MVYSKNHSNLPEIVVLRLSQIMTNQSAPDLKRSVMKFLVAKKCQPCEIYGRMCDVYGEEYFSQKSLQLGLTCVCHDKPEAKRQSMEWEHIDSLVKKK